MRTTLFTALFALLCTCVHAQGFSGGFRAGLNFIALSGDQEMSADGMETFESGRRTTGFHVGATFAYEFTDLVGIKADLMYTQKGGERLFQGPGFFYLYGSPEDIEGDLLLGMRDSELDVVNSYIDIPLTAYYRLGPFEIEGGVSAGFLVNSRVTGGITYSNVALFNQDVIFSVDGNYFNDRPGGGGVVSFSDTPLPGNTGRVLPETISAYYNSNSDEKLYRRLDFGLVAGLSYYLNNGLYIGGRYQFGLTDVTRGENDLRFTADPANPGRNYNESDKDYTRTIQVSIGFRF